jgi:hypothetical protein
MKQLQLVDQIYVHQIWDKIKPFFEASYEQGPKDCTVDQLRMLLSRGAQHLFIIVEDSEIIGAFSVEIVNHPNAKSATTTAMGGKGLFTEETITQYETWARSQGATKIKAFAKEAQARLYRQKLGLETTMFVVEKAI